MSRARLREVYKQLGDLGDVAQACRSRQVRSDSLGRIFWLLVHSSPFASCARSMLIVQLYMPACRLRRCLVKTHADYYWCTSNLPAALVVHWLPFHYADQYVWLAEPAGAACGADDRLRVQEAARHRHREGVGRCRPPPAVRRGAHQPLQVCGSHRRHLRQGRRQATVAWDHRALCLVAAQL